MNREPDARSLRTSQVSYTTTRCWGIPHAFNRLRGEPENTVTNNTLLLLARIYHHSPSRAEYLLRELTGVEDLVVGLKFAQQERGAKSVPDGCIVQSSFKILLEAKVDQWVSMDQLEDHAEAFADQTEVTHKILLLLTKQPLTSAEEETIRKRLGIQGEAVVFRSVTYERICEVTSELFQEHEHEMRSLVEDYVAYCNETGLSDQSRFLLRIVPCGDTLALNKKYGIYFHRSDRGYTPHAFVGIYSDRTVQSLWALDTVLDVDVDSDGRITSKKLVQGRHTSDYDERIVAMIRDARAKCGYQIETGYRYFCGQPLDMRFKKTSPGGIQGPRFIDLREVIGEFSDAADVAAKLNEKEWK